MKENLNPTIYSPETFLIHLLGCVQKKSKTRIEDNFDTFRFTQIQKETYLKTIPAYIDFVQENHEALFDTYAMLSNESSRVLFINLLVYRMCGPDHVRIQSGWTFSKMKSFKEKATQYQTGQSELPFQWEGKPLYHYEDLPFREFLYNMESRENCGWFFTDQYFYTSPEANVQVESGDIVIDAGSCMGEGTVQFALIGGQEGHVYAFDPLPVHQEILNYNLKQNELQNRVTAVPYGLYDRNHHGDMNDTNQTVQAAFSLEHSENISDISTMTLDRFVKIKDLKKVDFVKMDIEGAELAALKGAKETIKRFKPKLAISLYHKWEDYTVIPAFLKRICPDYAFYLGHYTIHASETVLYAVVK